MKKTFTGSLFLLLGIGYIMSSCNGTTSSTESSMTDTLTNVEVLPMEEVSDTFASVEAEANANSEAIEVDATQMLKLFYTTYERPFAVDSQFFSVIKADNGTGINAGAIRLLSSKMADHDLGKYSQWTIFDAYKMDSLKSIDQYEAYLSTIDIGMTKSADAFAVGKIELGEEEYLLLWQIIFSSYEACPYFSGTSVYATLVKDGKLGQCIKLASEEGSGDPPASSQTQQYGKVLNAGQIEINQTEVFEEENEEGEVMGTITKKNYEFEWDNGNFVLVNETKTEENY